MPTLTKPRVPRLVEVVLVLSLALNLCVAGGFAYSQYTAARPMQMGPGGPDRRLEAFAERLGIDPAKSDAFKEWRTGLHGAQTGLFHANQPLVAELWQDLDSAAPDPAQVQPILDQMAANRRTFQTEATAATVKFLSTLDESQKKTFMSMVVDRSNPSAAPVRNSLGN